MNNDIRVDNEDASIYENNHNQNQSDHFQTKLISQVESEGAFESSQTTALLNVKNQPYASSNIKGKTAFDVTKNSESCLSVSKKQSAQQTKVMSINASDKGIEIAFKTNDVFSSQNEDDEELMGQLGIIQSPLKNRKEASQTQYDMSKQMGSHALNADILSQKVLADKITTGSNKRQTIQHQLFSSQGLSTAREDKEYSHVQSPSKLESMRNITSIEIIQEDTLNTGGQKKITTTQCNVQAAYRKTSKEYQVSEVRRQQMNQEKFRRTHDRKMAKTPELHARRHKQNEVQTQVQLGGLDSQSVGSLQTPMEPNLVNTGSATLQVENHPMYQANLFNNLTSPNRDIANDASSVYQDLQGSRQALLKANKNSSIHESEMLGLLDMYFGHGNVPFSLNSQRGTLSHSKEHSKEQLSNVGVGTSNKTFTLTTPMPGYQTAQAVPMQQFVSSLMPQQIQAGSKLTRVNPNQVGTGKSLPSRPNVGAKSAAARAAIYQQRQRNVVSQQQARGTNKRRLNGTTMSQDSQNLNSKFNVNKSLLLTNHINKKKTAQVKSGTQTLSKSMNVKQYKPQSTNQVCNTNESQRYGQPSNYGRDGETQIQQPTTVMTDMSIGTGSPEQRRQDILLPVNLQTNHNGSQASAVQVYSVNYHRQAGDQKFQSQSLTDSVYRNTQENNHSSNIVGSQNCTINPPSKFEEVVIPNVPLSSSQVNLRQVLRHHSEVKVSTHSSQQKDDHQIINFEQTMSQSTLAANPHQKMTVKQMRANNQSINSTFDNGENNTNQENNLAQSRQSLSTIMKPDTSPMPTTKHATKRVPLLKKSFELDEFGASGVMNEQGSLSSKAKPKDQNLNLPSGSQIASTLLGSNRLRIQDLAANNPDANGPAVDDSTRLINVGSMDTSRNGGVVVHGRVRSTLLPPDDRMQIVNQDLGQMQQSPDQRMTPSGAYQSNRGTTERSYQLHNKTPDFLKVLGHNIDDFMPHSVFDPSNQDISLLISENHKIEPSSSNVMNQAEEEQSLTTHSQMREDGAVTQPLLSELGARESFDEQQQSSSFMKKSIQGQQVGKKKLPQVTVKSRGGDSSLLYLINQQSQLVCEQKPMAQTGNDNIHVQDFAALASEKNKESEVNLMNMNWPYFHGGVIKHRGDESSKQSQSTSLRNTSRRPQTQQMNSNTIGQAQHATVVNYQAVGANSTISQGLDWQNHQRLVSKKRSHLSRQGVRSKQQARSKQQKAGGGRKSSITSDDKALSGGVQVNQTDKSTSKDQKQPITSETGTFIQGKRFSQTGQSATGTGAISYEEFVKNMEIMNQIGQKKQPSMIDSSTKTASQTKITVIAGKISARLDAKESSRQSQENQRRQSLLFDDDQKIASNFRQSQPSGLNEIVSDQMVIDDNSGHKIVGVIGDFATMAISHNKSYNEELLRNQQDQQTLMMLSFQENTTNKNEPSTLVKVHQFDADKSHNERSYQKVLTEEQSSARSLKKLLTDESPYKKQFGYNTTTKVNPTNLEENDQAEKNQQPRLALDAQMTDHEQSQESLMNTGTVRENTSDLHRGLLKSKALFQKEVNSLINSSDNDGGGFSDKLKIGFKAVTDANNHIDTQAKNNPKTTSNNNATVKKTTKNEKRASATSSRFEQKQSSVRDRVNSSLQIGKAPGGGFNLQAVVNFDTDYYHEKKQVSKRTLSTQNEDSRFNENSDGTLQPIQNHKINTRITEAEHETEDGQAAIKTEEDENETLVNTEQKPTLVNLIQNTQADEKSNDQQISSQVSGVKINLNEQVQSANSLVINLTIRNENKASHEQLTKARIEHRQKMEAANNVNSVVQNMNQSYFLGDMIDLAQQQQRQIQKGLVASIPHMYAYKPKKPFNIQNLGKQGNNNGQAATEQKSVQAHIIDKRLRQTEEFLLQKKMTESFLANTHETQLLNIIRKNHPQPHQIVKVHAMDRVPRCKTIEPKGRYIKQASSGTQTQNLTIVPKSSNHISIESQESQITGQFMQAKNTNQRNIRNSTIQTSLERSSKAGSVQDELIVRGQQPYQTQYQTTSTNVDKFIAVQDQNQKEELMEQLAALNEKLILTTDITNASQDLIPVTMIQPYEVQGTLEDHVRSLQQQIPRNNETSIASTIQDGITIQQNNSQNRACEESQFSYANKQSTMNLAESPLIRNSNQNADVKETVDYQDDKINSIKDDLSSQSKGLTKIYSSAENKIMINEAPRESNQSEISDPEEKLLLEGLRVSSEHFSQQINPNLPGAAYDSQIEKSEIAMDLGGNVDIYSAMDIQEQKNSCFSQQITIRAKKIKSSSVTDHQKSQESDLDKQILGSDYKD